MPRLALVLLCVLFVSGCGRTQHQQPRTDTAAPFCAARLGEFAVHASTAPRFGTPLVSGPDGAAYVCLITPDLQTNDTGRLTIWSLTWPESGRCVP